MVITPSILLIAFASFIGIVYIPSLVATKQFQKAIKGFVADKNIVRLNAIVLMIMSFLFLSVHWKLSGGWFMLISIIGWALLLKGIAWFWKPEYVEKMVKKVMLKSENMTSFLGFVALLIAIGLLYVGIYIY